MRRVLLTGASGCIGHYIAEALVESGDCELWLWVRDRRKFRLDCADNPRVHFIEADLSACAAYREVLATFDTAILTAAAWGDPEVTYAVNVTQTLRLLECLDPQVCRQVIYFSTASILDYEEQPLPAAARLGTDYIRTKFECYQRLRAGRWRDRLTVLFPTVVLGGDATKPASHVSAGMPQLTRWVGLLRWVRADGSFHFIHARDIARVVGHLVARGQPAGSMVLGSPRVTADELILAFCRYLNKQVYLRVPLSFGLADLLVAVLPIQMAAWDRFCLRYRHFVHRNPVTPASFGLTVYCPTLEAAFKLSGIPPAPRR